MQLCHLSIYLIIKSIGFFKYVNLKYKRNMCKGYSFQCFYYRPQRSCGKVMLLHLFVILFTGGSLSKGGFCPGCLCPGGSLSGGLCSGSYLSRGPLSMGRGSLSGGLCLGVSVHGGLCPRGVSVWLRAGGMHPNGMHFCY